MLNKDAMRGMIRNWVLVPRPDVYRIHLSHDDMDGYCCQVVTNYIQTKLLKENNHLKKKQKIHFANCGYGLSEQRKTVADAIDKFSWSSYRKGIDIISFLVTDLSNFDPDAVFKPAIDDGHCIEWLVVDHHTDQNSYGEKYEYRTELLETKPLTSAWFTFTDCSAARHIYEAFEDFDLAPFYKYRKYIIHFNRDGSKYDHETYEADLEWGMETLGHITKAVSDSDTGFWGTWNTKLFGDVTAAVKMKLLWSFYSCYNGGGKLWYIMMCEYLFDTQAHEYYEDLFTLIQEPEWKELNDEYDRFKLSVSSQPWTGAGQRWLEAVCPTTYKEYTVMYMVLRKAGDLQTNFPNFSILAQTYLNENPGVDIIAGYDGHNRENSLRTAKDDVNCAELAARYGGGGHPKAAGFPDPEREFESEPETKTE